MPDRAIECRALHESAGQVGKDIAGQSKRVQGSAGKCWAGRKGHRRTGHCRTEQESAVQCRTVQESAEQIGQDSAGHSKRVQDSSGQSKSAGQCRTALDRAIECRTVQDSSGQSKSVKDTAEKC